MTSIAFEDADAHQRDGIKRYSWRKTLAFFVFAAVIGWAGVFGVGYVVVAVIDSLRGGS